MKLKEHSILLKPWCWCVGIFRNIEAFVTGNSLHYGFWDGHTHKEDEVHENVTVFVSRCIVCGKYDIRWKK